jgi:hypothetical protein
MEEALDSGFKNLKKIMQKDSEEQKNLVKKHKENF